MVNLFLQYLQYERRCSPHTLSAYQRDLEQFTHYLSTAYELSATEEASFSMIRSWIVSLVEQKMEATSINRKIATLRSFYKFLLKKKSISQDPMQKVVALKTSRSLPAFVDEQPMALLLDHIEFPSDFSGLRDKFILELLYGTGIRLSELINLKEGDINSHDQVVKVTGKGNKQRIVPIHNSLLPLLETYSLGKRSQFEGKSVVDYLIVTDKGEQSYPMMIQRIVKKYLDMITTIEKRSPHILRHSFATHLLNKGADLNAIKDLLGHASLGATQVYTHNSLDRLKQVFEQAHPKA
ncbi:MAG: tyrosine-type recombinase/integrase [Bacteroidota bacterium]